VAVIWLLEGMPDDIQSAAIKFGIAQIVIRTSGLGIVMSYWWVNQNQTAKHEIGGSYLWSPKLNRNDSYNQFYENMRLAEPGDVVFSFYDQHIQHLGIVQSRAVTAPKPTEFAGAGHYWSEEGWLVPVQWRALPLPYRPKDIIPS
jgi:hypothetical protein